MEQFDQWLDANLAEHRKRVTQMARRVAVAVRRANRGFDQGNLNDLQNALREIESTCNELPEAAHAALSTAQEYDIQQYLRDDFDAAFRQACAERGLPVEGTYPTYLLPPVTVRVDARSARVRVNRRSLPGLRISRVLDAIVRERDRITRRPFNAREFLSELATAYDELVVLESARQGGNLDGIERSLRQLYQRLTPRRMWRAEYPEAFFAYDLHRLLASDQLYLPDGRRYYLSPSRNARTNMTILDRNGRQVQYGVIAFRKE